MEMERAAGVLADGTPAPPVPPVPPLPPPPPHSDHQKEKPRVSRYRSLRGKSLSSPRRNKTFVIFHDNQHGTHQHDAAGHISPTRSRSRSAAASKRCDVAPPAAKEFEHRRQQTRPAAPTAKLPLKPKSINVSSSPASPTSLKPLRATRSLNLGSRRREPDQPPPLPSKPEKQDAPPTAPRQTDDEEELQPREPDARDEAVRWAEEVARLEAETDRILAEQKKRDLARLQAQLAASPSSRRLKPKPKPQRLILDKLGFLTRGSKSNVAGQPATPKSAPAKIFATTVQWTTPPSVGTPSPEIMSLLGHGGVDAPTSASNGGERRVTVRCLTSTINLPVMPDTSPVDIAYATANSITHKIDPATCIVIECYHNLGLERRLRRYENIRDVMNSWDRDQQNTLLVVSGSSPQDIAALELASAPKTEDPPIGFTFQLHHSSRPGKWSKRWITLMDSGQIYAAKRPECKPTDKDSTILCHLSDFDIFTPSEDGIKRDVKAPKKFCHAIKSQQKTNLFPTGENFVHFFCTDEEALAQRFHELIFGWRSWYLAQKKGDIHGDKAPTSLRRSATTSTSKKSPSISRHNSRREGPSAKNTYTIGDFKPLIDMQRFDKPLEEFGRTTPSAKQPVEVQSTEVASPTVLTKFRTQPFSLPQSPESEGDFLAGGLLGDAYEKRKRADTVTQVKKVEGPFIEGPSLLNKIPSSPTSSTGKSPADSWFPSALEHSTRTRIQTRPSQRRPATADNAQSRRDAPPPLPNHPESFRSRPSQRLGVGRGVKPPTGSPLIDFATGGATSSQPIRSHSNKARAGPSTYGKPHSGRPRNHSTATTRSGGQRYIPADHPPMPPLPHRSVRHPAEGRGHAEPTRGRGPRVQEPLINRVK